MLEIFVKYWVPVIAIVISVVSLCVSVLVSLSNSRFNKRFEAAKKRTELLSLVLQNMTGLSIRREQVNSALKRCKECGDCPQDMIDKILSEFERSLKSMERSYSSLEKLNSPDPIKVEYMLAPIQNEIAAMSIDMEGIDEFIAKSKECAEEKEKGSSKQINKIIPRYPVKSENK